MCKRIIYVLVLVQFNFIIAKNRGESCTTPNNEPATCKPIQDCQVIYNAIATQKIDAVKFAQAAQCGFDSTPLVCCGPTAYYRSTTPRPVSTVPQKSSIATQPKSSNRQVILNDFRTSDLPDRTVCGFEKESKRVYGGEITDLDEFPWMAALEFKSKYTGENGGIRCGGSIINNRYILTAAHCILDKEFEIISVWLGDWRLSTDPDCIDGVAISECSSVLKLKPKEQIPHPFYNNKIKNNDIGLIQLERDITFTDYIRPICLPPENLPTPEVNTLLTVVGWGITENGSSSDIKLKVQVPMLLNDVCNRQAGRSKLSSNQLCAGGEGGKDSCRGDSGGPLMRTYQDSKSFESQWYQEGVVSWGLNCGLPGSPATYTRIARYVNWILNNIGHETNK